MQTCYIAIGCQRLLLPAKKVIKTLSVCLKSHLIVSVA